MKFAFPLIPFIFDYKTLYNMYYLHKITENIKKNNVKFPKKNNY